MTISYANNNFRCEEYYLHWKLLFPSQIIIYIGNSQEDAWAGVKDQHISRLVQKDLEPHGAWFKVFGSKTLNHTVPAASLPTHWQHISNTLATHHLVGIKRKRCCRSERTHCPTQRERETHTQTHRQTHTMIHFACM